MTCTKDGELTSLPKVNYEKIINADRNRVFEMATDYVSFQRHMPQYFPSVRIRSSRDSVTIVEQHVRLFSRNLVMMTKHVVRYPVFHEVFVIGGDAKGSHIVERYDTVSEGTKIVISADICLAGVLRIAGFFKRSKIQNGLAEITDEFAKLVENQS